MSLIFTDTSYYQPAANNRYPHHWISFRSNDGTFRDPKFYDNLHWSQGACKRGLTKVSRAKAKLLRQGYLRGYTVYLVFRPGMDNFDTLKAMLGKPDRFVTVMIDVESWGGKIRGNQSERITNLAEHIASYLGSKSRVLVYANRYDFENLYPHRPSWLRTVVAGYGSVKPDFPHMIGWQYSDGEDRYPVPHGYPRSSAPFGRCDHNVIPSVANAGDFAHIMGLPGTSHSMPVKHVKPVPSKSSHPKAPKHKTHEVRRGDTLGALAAHYHVSLSSLIKWNRKRYPVIGTSHGSMIKVGWTLRVSR